MKGLLTGCWPLLLLGLAPAVRAEFDECRFMDQVLIRLGKSMAINRMIIAESSDDTAVAAAQAALAQQNDSYRSTKRQRSKAGCDGWGRD